MLDRRRPDLPARDVAGMLRSFDYVAGSTAIALPERAEAAVAWADAARQAFIDGYVAASGLDLSAYRDLLAAFELDKAVYEAIYEARNRPTWAAIPLHAIMSLLESGPLRATPEPRRPTGPSRPRPRWPSDRRAMTRRMGPIKRAWLWTIKHTLNPLTLRMARQGNRTVLARAAHRAESRARVRDADHPRAGARRLRRRARSTGPG